MLSFSEEYFRAEEREDFFVSETMKRYWACCMEIVNVIDGICKRHGITYYADWGTLLGAVRHKGFIPWDDDMDIAVKRPDYERLLKILQRELPEGYKLSTPFNSEEHRQFFSGVSNGTEMDLSKAHVEKFYGCPFVAVIDIFPLDYLPRDPKEEELVRSLFVIIWNAVQLIKDEAEPEEIERAVRDVEEYLNVKIDRNKQLRSQLWKLANQLAMSYHEEEGDYLVPWCSYINYGVKFDKHWYDEVSVLPFEEMQLPVPRDYEPVLEAMYGNWRVRVKGTQAHDYPCFKKQLEFLRRKVAELKEQERLLQG